MEGADTLKEKKEIVPIVTFTIFSPVKWEWAGHIAQQTDGL